MRRVVAVGLCLATLAVAACASSSAPTNAPVADAAKWKLWVLPAPDAVPVPPPPPGTPDASLATAEPGAGDPLGGSWLELAMSYVSARTKDPPAASRTYALVSVAAYDALAAARHWQGVFGGAYPSESAAVAGAASRTLAYLFPEQPALRLEQRADEAAATAAADGNRPAADAGLALGRQVGDAVIAYGRGDGSDRVWDGTRPPDEPRYWGPPPGSVSPPVQPLAGTWRTWVLDAGDALRPPPPPDYGSRAFLAEAQELVVINERLTDEQRRIAKYWEGGEGTPLPAGIWNQIVLQYLRDHDVGVPEAVRALALVNVALADAGVAAWDAKYTYWLPRPENGVRDLIDPAWTPLLRTPLFPAYVSGHSTYSAATAEVLAYLFPADAARFRAMGEEAGLSRLYGGIHWRADHVEGSRMGREIGRLVVARARADSG
ncbi:MAG: vanadium-dependent haloperoxidase [Acidimicrobiales bacterium]